MKENPLKTLFAFIIRSTRNQSLGLLTIGLAVFACSNLAEQTVTDWTTREVVQLLVIAAGISATAMLFRRADSGTHRD